MWGVPNSPLKKMPHSPVPAVIAHGITGQQTSHNRRYRRLAGSKQQVKIVGYQRPGVAARTAFTYYRAEPLQKRIPVRIIIEYLATADASGNNVMKRSRRIDAGGSGHAEILASGCHLGKFKCWVRP
jgi:hypothetical protein